MSDLISRQAAIDALNKMKIYRPLDSDRYVISDCLNKIVNLPSAQPEIIRCKECKHWFDIDDGRQKHRMCADLYGDWFCADAERRQNGTRD